MKKKMQERSQKVATSSDISMRISATAEGKWCTKYLKANEVHT